MRRGDGHFEAVVHGFMIGLRVSAIEPPHEWIQLQPAKIPLALGCEFLGLVGTPTCGS